MNKKNCLLLILIVFLPTLAFASGAGEHSFLPNLLLGLVIIIFSAKIMGHIAIRLGQPAVLGELTAGLVFGNLALLNINYFDFLKSEISFEILSELGVILLLFQVGLETNISEMKKVGLSAFFAATLGVVVPFILGYFVSSYFMPEAEMLVHVFVGATLTATSVGITARVLKDLGKIQTKEGQIILGAAVIDDVLGLLTLAVVTGLVSSANSGKDFEIYSLLKIIGFATGFLFSAIFLGIKIIPRIFTFANKLHSESLLLGTSLFICFALSYLAYLAGLAPIVGAFSAGLILDSVHYKELQKKSKNFHLEDLISPISSFFVPVFFVIMGTKVDVSVFGNSTVVIYALFLTLAAVLGKQVCGLGVLDKSVNKLAVGVGMIPRGEVGLIFVGIGAGLTLHGKTVVDSSTFGAVVIMVIVTTMLTPPLIKWRFKELGKK